MKTSLYAISLILLLNICSVYAEKNPDSLQGLGAVSYSAGYSMVDSFNKIQLFLTPEMVMRGLEDARKSIRPLMPKGQMRMILRDPKQYLIDDKDKELLGKESDDLYGLGAVSYAAGFRMGDTFKKQSVPLVSDMVSRGLMDAHNSIRPLIPEAEIRTIMRDPKKYLIENSQNRAVLAKQSSESFLQEMSRQEGVKVMESGLLYKVLAAGEGDKPRPIDSVRLNYQGTTINGQIFDSTYKSGEPAVLKVDRVIPGLSEGLQLMSEGSEWEFYIPAKLAYGNYGPLAEETLIYTVKLLEIIPRQ